MTKKCTAGIILDSQTRILLLKRSPIDSFHPSTWCLPGGGIDGGEYPDTAVCREIKEESGLDKNQYTLLLPSKIVKVPKCEIHYYVGYLNNDVSKEFLMLDNNEHVQYDWCTIFEWMQMDLILDLKKHLQQIML